MVPGRLNNKMSDTEFPNSIRAARLRPTNWNSKIGKTKIRSGILGSRNYSMLPSRVFLVILGCSWLPLSVGCSPSHGNNESRHHGPKINVSDFITHAAAYKNRSITLALTVDEPIDRLQGQSLRDFVGRDVKFMNSGPKGERLNIVITIPAGLSVPDVARSDEVSVTFLCSLGNLSRGNEAQMIAVSSRRDGD
jgi:hypothetical protein